MQRMAIKIKIKTIIIPITITITKANTCNNYKLIKTNPQSLKNQQLNINVNEPINANTNKT